MARKTEVTNNEAIVKLYRELLKVVDVPDKNFIDNMEGDSLRDFQKFCHEVYHNKFFKEIFDRFVFIQCMCTADNAVTPEQIMNGKLMVAGFETIRGFFKECSNQYQVEHLTPKGNFDPYKSFEPGKV